METESTNFEVGIGPLIAQLDAMVSGFIAQIPYIVIGILLLFTFFWIARRVEKSVSNLASRGRLSDQAGIAFGRIARYATIIIGILIAMIIIFPGLDVTALLGSLGVSGVIIGFAFRDILQNFFAGMILLLSEPFKIGDQIVVDGFEGTVCAIDLRATTIRMFDGRHVIIPNAELFIDSVVVETAEERRRSQYDVGIGYGDDIEEARAAMMEAMQDIEGVAKEPAPDVRVVDLGDSAVVLRARWWTEPSRGEVVPTNDSVLTAIKYKLDEKGIDMPYPTHVTLFHDQTEETDGSRADQREGWPTNPDGNNPRARRVVQALSRNGSEGNSKQPSG